MTAKVGDGENDCTVGFDDKEHAEGKSVEDGAPRLTQDYGEALRPFFNS